MICIIAIITMLSADCTGKPYTKRHRLDAPDEMLNDEVSDFNEADIFENVHEKDMK